jgi:chorismate-pyruvate lyase
MTKTQKDIVHLHWLLHMFYRSPDDLATFEEVQVSDVPTIYQTLLAHDQHMTVTVERHHGCDVNVVVLQERMEEPFYTREILLTRATDSQVVQYGLVRLFLPSISEAAKRDILSKEIPLGKVLIEHNIMREVRLGELWHVESQNQLAQLFNRDSVSTYGRTALIYFDDRPALELLEIVTPEEPSF